MTAEKWADEKINTILEGAQLAPSVIDLQPY